MRANQQTKGEAGKGSRLDLSSFPSSLPPISPLCPTLTSPQPLSLFPLPLSQRSYFTPGTKGWEILENGVVSNI